MWDFSIFYRQYTRQMRDSCLITWFCKIWPHVTSIRRAFAVHFSTAQNSKTSIDFDWKFSIKISFEVILEKNLFRPPIDFRKFAKTFRQKTCTFAPPCVLKYCIKMMEKLTEDFLFSQKTELINFRFFNLFNLYIN